jgi:hypothetical protein
MNWAFTAGAVLGRPVMQQYKFKITNQTELYIQKQKKVFLPLSKPHFVCLSHRGKIPDAFCNVHGDLPWR